MRLVCIPNLSTGQGSAVGAALADAVESHGAVVLDRSYDVDHNRTVLTITGDRLVLGSAIEALYAAAIERLDLRSHKGVHPRIGAVDVTPFVPLRHADLPAAARQARDTAARVAARHGLPTFLYEAAARREPRDLPTLRRGGLAGLAERLASGDAVPDFGPSTLHPTAGATVIGARGVLIAFNVLLASDDASVARRIAARIREAGRGRPESGLPKVRAIGVSLPSQGCSQVSMNLLDYRITPPIAAFRRVAREARREGVSVQASELIGLVPSTAISTAEAEEMMLIGDLEPRLLENRLSAL